MAAENGTTKTTLLAKTLIYGALTSLMYAAVFSYAEPVMKLFTKGGLYAAMPIGTVFLFSFAHGNFAGNLWSLLGIEAVTKQTTERPEVRPEKRPSQRPRPRLRMSA